MKQFKINDNIYWAIINYSESIEELEDYKKIKEDFIKESPKEISKTRVKEFTLSRFLLKKLKDQEAKITNYSISHTKDCAACIISIDEKTKVGIDIEEINRIISPGVSKYFENQSDKREISLLDKWCLKEASYKCLHHYLKENKPKSLLPIIVKDKSFSYLDILGENMINEVKLEKSIYKVAIAIISSKK